MTGQRLNNFSLIKERESVATAGTADMIGGALATTSPRKQISDQAPDGSKGLRIGKPRPLTPAAFRVTSTKPCTFTVAARSASTKGTERMAEIRPQLSATAASIPSMRGPAASTIACSHTSSARLFRISAPNTFDTPPDRANGRCAEEEASILDARPPLGKGGMAARPFSDLRDDICINKLGHSSTARPMARGRLRLVPSSGAD